MEGFLEVGVLQLCLEALEVANLVEEGWKKVFKERELKVIPIKLHILCFIGDFRDFKDSCDEVWFSHYALIFRAQPSLQMGVPVIILVICMVAKRVN